MLRNNRYIDLGSRPHTYGGKKAEGDSLPNAANQNNSLLDFADSGSDLFFFLPLSRLHVSSVPDLLCTVTLDVLVSFKLQQIQPRQI